MIQKSYKKPMNLVMSFSFKKNYIKSRFYSPVSFKVLATSKLQVPTSCKKLKVKVKENHSFYFSDSSVQNPFSVYLTNYWNQLESQVKLKLCKMSEQYKLTYFNGRGRAEAIRLLLAYGNLPYEDIRINYEDWPSLKKQMPWGHVPILEVNGKMIAQSYAIMRFLAKKCKLYRDDAFEAAKVDEYAYSVEDFRAEIQKFSFEKDPEQRAHLKEILISTRIPHYMEKFSKITLLSEEEEPGPYLFGQNITYADILLASVLDALEISVDPDILNCYPVMKALKDSVFDNPNIKDYVEKRLQ